MCKYLNEGIRLNHNKQGSKKYMKVKMALLNFSNSQSCVYALCVYALCVCVCV